MKFCHKCGAMMEDHDCYCCRCGKAERKAELIYHNASNTGKETPDKLFCQLAYVGFLFWLPLVFCKNEEYGVRSANQGLWALIAATICCTAIRLAGAVNTFLAGSILGALFGGVYALMFILFLPFMFFLMWKCLRNVFQIHRGKQIEPILFFDRMALIR